VPVVRPPQFDFDYGAPLDDVCSGNALSDPNVFSRRYTHYTAILNCTSYESLGF
jgi:hypothetical protein